MIRPGSTPPASDDASSRTLRGPGRPPSGGGDAGHGDGGRASDGIELPLDGFRICLFLLVVLTVSRVHQHVDAVAALRPAKLLAGASLLFGLLSSRRLSLGELVEQWPAKVMAALAVMACLSAPFGLSLGGSATFILQRYSKVLILAFLLVAAIRDTRDLYFFAWAYVLGAGILAWMAVLMFEVHPTAAQGTVRRLNDLYTYDANDMGCVLMVALPLTLLVFWAARGWGKSTALLVLAGMGLAVARSGSRGAFVGLAAVCLALVVWVTRVSLTRRLAVLAVVVLGVVIASPAGYWDQMATLADLEDDYNVTSPVGRVALAKRGMGYMLDHPLSGIGVQNFARAEGTISRRAKNFIPEPGKKLEWMAPHNSYIQAGAEMGLPGLLLWSSLVFGGIVGLRRLRKRLPRRRRDDGAPEEEFLHDAAVFLPVSLAGFAVTASFVSFAYMDPIYILSAFVCGLYACVERRRRGDDGPAAGAGTATPAPGVVAAGSPPRLSRPRRSGAPGRTG